MTENNKSNEITTTLLKGYISLELKRFKASLMNTSKENIYGDAVKIFFMEKFKDLVFEEIEEGDHISEFIIDTHDNILGSSSEVAYRFWISQYSSYEVDNEFLFSLTNEYKDVMDELKSQN